MGILVGYRTISKGYIIYNLSLQKIVVSRDVKIDEDLVWNWEYQGETSHETRPQVVEQFVQNQNSTNKVHEDMLNGDSEEELNDEETHDHMPVRGFRSLEKIYAHCNVATLEPNTCFEALQFKD